MKRTILMNYFIFLFAIIIFTACGEDNSEHKNDEARPSKLDTSATEESSTVTEASPDTAITLTDKQLEKYLELKNFEPVKALRKNLNMYLKGKTGGDCIDQFAITPDSYNGMPQGLDSFSKGLLKRKFIIMSIADNTMGGADVTISFYGVPDRLFTAWLYHIENCWQLRSFSERSVSKKALEQMKIMFARYLSDEKYAF